MSKGPPNGQQLLKSIATIKSTIDELSALNANGVFNDKEQKKQQALAKKIGDLKQGLAEQLSGNATGSKTSVSPGRRKSPVTQVAIASDGDREALEDFFEELILDTDNKPGNLPLVRAMLSAVPLDFARLSLQRGLLSTCAVDGSMGFLDALLTEASSSCVGKGASSLPATWFDAEELIRAAMFNQQFRIPLMTLLLKFEPLLAMETIAEALTPLWQEFVVDISSKKKAIPREDRTGQRALLERMLTHPLVKLDCSAQGGDGLSLFSRSCLEGDVATVQLLVQKQLCPPINQMNGDGMTALMHAVVSNVPPIVKILLSSFPTIDLAIEGPHGNALNLANTLKRDPAIVQMLRDAKQGRSGLSALEGATNHSATFSAGPVLGSEVTAVAPKRQLPSLGKMPAPSPPAPAVKPTAAAAAKKPPARLDKIKGAPSPGTSPNVTPRVQKDGPAPLAAVPSRSHASSESVAMKEAAGTGSAMPKHLAGLNATPQSSTPRPPPVSTQSQNPRNDFLSVPSNPQRSHSTPTKSLEPLTSEVSDLILESSRDDMDLLLRRSSTQTRRDDPLSPKRSPRDNLLRGPAPNGTSNLSRENTSSSLQAETTVGSLYSLGSTLHTVATSNSSNGESRLDLASVLAMIRQISGERTETRRRASMGVFTDEEVLVQESSESKMTHHKAKLAHRLGSESTLASASTAIRKIRVPIGSDEEEEIGSFFATCVLESDADAVNRDLVLSMLRVLDMDFADVCQDNALIEAAATDGSVHFLEALLKVPSVRYDLQETILGCLFNQQFRIPLVLVLFRSLAKSQLQTIRKDMWNEYCEFFQELCSEKKAIPGEQREGRMDLIDIMITHPILPLDPKAEGSDGMTVFARVAHEADAELMKLLLRRKFTHDPNMVLTDGATALVHAVYGGSYDVIAAMLSHIPNVDATFKAPASGSAIAVARNLKREAKIMKLLEQYGGADPLAESRIFQVPTLPPLESRFLEASFKSVRLPKVSPVNVHRTTKKSTAKAANKLLADVPDFADELELWDS